MPLCPSQFLLAPVRAQERRYQLPPRRVTHRCGKLTITRLIGGWNLTRQIQPLPPHRPNFPRRYQSSDIALLAQVDQAHADLSGPAIRRILQREFAVYGRREFERLAQLSEVARWRCRTPECRYRVFTERLPSVVARYGRHSSRLIETSRVVGRLLGGRPSQGLLSRLGMPVNRHTVLRRVREAAHTSVGHQNVRVVGVDEWAWKKGQSFGTILVDLENRRVVDVLPTRSAKAFAVWLEQHPEVAVIARDRQGLYAQGGRRGAPGAVEVADRFHLIQNLREAVERALAVQRPHLRLTANKEVVPPQSLPSKEGRRIKVRSTLAQTEAEVVRQRRQEKLELFHAVKRMQKAGMRVSKMAQHLGVSRRRLDKWVRLEELPERNRMQPRVGMAESFREYLRQRWEGGCRHGRTLLGEVRQQGHIGGHSQLAKLISPWRQPALENTPTSNAVVTRSIAVPGRAISPQVAAALLIKLPAELNSQQADVVARLKQQCPGFTVMRKLFMGFRAILQRGTVSSLRHWMKRARNTGIHAMIRFVRTLQQDIAAVEAAVSQPWSNGPVEGQINRLKMPKRQMYGKGGIELLGARPTATGPSHHVETCTTIEPEPENHGKSPAFNRWLSAILGWCDMCGAPREVSQSKRKTSL